MATLINVCGQSFSGTTMLDLMLGNAADAFSCGEVRSWFRPYRTHHFNIICSCGEVPCPVWKKIKIVPENQFHLSVIRELGVRFVIDSSKDLNWVIDNQRWAATNGLETFNLVLWKSPIDIAYSFWKRGQGLMGWRRPFVGYYGKLLKLGLPFQSVHFSALCSDPSKFLSLICKRIEMPYFEGKERFWEKTHHHLFGNLGTRKQIEARTSTIRTREPFPPEFLIHIKVLTERIADDHKVQGMLNKLETSDIAAGDPIAGSASDQWLSPPYPIWYYFQRVKSLFQRHFPQEWPHSQ